MEKNKDYKARTSIDADDTYGMEFTLFNVVNDSNQPLGYYYARILYVLPNSPASSAGLERGDWIVGVKGKNNINSDNYGILLNCVSSSTFPKNVVSNALVIVNITL